MAELADYAVLVAVAEQGSLTAAVQGLGIARAPLRQVREHRGAGRLALVLGGWDLPAMPVHLLRPPVPPPSRVRLLAAHLARNLDLAGL